MHISAAVPAVPVPKYRKVVVRQNDQLCIIRLRLLQLMPAEQAPFAQMR